MHVFVMENNSCHFYMPNQTLLGLLDRAQGMGRGNKFWGLGWGQALPNFVKCSPVHLYCKH